MKGFAQRCDCLTLTSVTDFHLESRYVGVLKKFSKYIEGSVIEGAMDPAVVGKFKMTPLVSSMASDLKKAAEANDSVSGLCGGRQPNDVRYHPFVSFLTLPKDYCCSPILILLSS